MKEVILAKSAGFVLVSRGHNGYCVCVEADCKKNVYTYGPYS
ncbi:MAG: hypothetical protein ACLRMX_11375 [Lachnospira eligens]